MSNTTKKTVKINESALVDLIDNIVNEAVEKKKVEWLAEQESKKANLLEAKIAKLEKTIAGITKR
jgi:hypothetical protein